MKKGLRDQFPQVLSYHTTQETKPIGSASVPRLRSKLTRLVVVNLERPDLSVVTWLWMWVEGAQQRQVKQHEERPTLLTLTSIQSWENFGIKVFHWEPLPDTSTTMVTRLAVADHGITCRCDLSWGGTKLVNRQDQLRSSIRCCKNCFFDTRIRKAGRFDRGIRPTVTTSPPSFIV